MKALLCAVAFVFLANCCFGQKVPNIYQIRADTVRIYNTCDTAEFVLENRTKDTLGFLFNKGKGRTEFRHLGLERIGASQLAIKGQDTIDLGFSSFGDTRYDLLSTNFVTIPSGDSLLFAQWPNMKVVGYDAYSSPDMPVLSRQAIQGMGNKTYYNGLVVRDGNSGFDFAVNWDGELNGPNGAFLRTKDDTKQAWSKWRELLFKDYADTTYAPIRGSGNYIQNTTTTQTAANSTIDGIATSARVITTSGTTAGGLVHMSLRTSALNRWGIGLNNAESTGNAGSDLTIWRYADDGSTILGATIAITRSTGLVSFAATPMASGNTMWHAGNHAAGSAFTPILTGANVLSAFTTNAAGHVTALTTRTLTATDISAAPSSGSGSYIQNQNTSAQSANMWINGAVSAPVFSSNQNTGIVSIMGGLSGGNQGGRIDLYGGTSSSIPGMILFRTGTGMGTQPERMRIKDNGRMLFNSGGSLYAYTFGDPDQGGGYQLNLSPSTANNAVSFVATTAGGTPVRLGFTGYPTTFTGGVGYSIASTSASSITLDTTQRTLLVNTAGAATVTLPAAISNSGREYTIKKISAAGNNVTINVSGGGNIDGSTSFIIQTQYAAITVQSDGSQWRITGAWVAGKTTL